MKKIFYLLVLLVSYNYGFASTSVQKQFSSYDNQFLVDFNVYLIGPKYTCTVDYLDDHGNYTTNTGTSDVSATDACNKAMRDTQTNDAISE